MPVEPYLTLLKLFLKLIFSDAAVVSPSVGRFDSEDVGLDGVAVGFKVSGLETVTAGSKVGFDEVEVEFDGSEAMTARLEVKAAGLEDVRTGLKTEVTGLEVESSGSDDGLAGSRFGRPAGTLIDCWPIVTVVG